MAPIETPALNQTRAELGASSTATLVSHDGSNHDNIEDDQLQDEDDNRFAGLFHSCHSLQTVASNITASSTESLVCRICQLSEKETGEELQESGCNCKGSIKLCHRSCLHQWVRQRLSVRCELCQQNFPLQLLPDSPHNGEDMNNNESSAFSQQLARQRDRTLCGDKRRVWFIISFVILLFSTGITCALTIYTYDDYQRALADQETSSAKQKHGYPYDPYIRQKLRNLEFLYWFSAAILVLSASLLLLVSVFWSFAELCIWPTELRTVFGANLDIGRTNWNILDSSRSGQTYRIVENSSSRNGEVSGESGYLSNLETPV